MASISTNPDTDLSRSRKKRRKIDSDDGAEASLSSIDHTRWRTTTEQQIYSSKLVEALRHIRRNDTPTTGGGRAVRDTADRVLAVTAKGKTRWSRAILTSRLSMRLNQINRKHKRAKAAKAKAKSAGIAAGDITLRKKKKEPALQKKVRVLGNLVPGCRKISFPNLLEETTDYIAALEMQVRAMSVLTELLTAGGGGGGGGGLSAAPQPDRLGPDQS